MLITPVSALRDGLAHIAMKRLTRAVTNHARIPEYVKRFPM
jgi:hypothetical protein